MGTGNICQPSTCPLPAGVGSITWNGMKCPLVKGDVTVGTDVILSGALPPWAARATIGIKGKASNGDDLLCMPLSTAPAEAPIVIQQSHPSLALPNGGTLKLAYQDWGASHGKVAGLSPNTLTLGQKTTVTGSGNVDEEVTDGTFQMTVKASILTKTCTGNICQPSTCPLPAGVGSITWNGMKCPLAKGDVTVGTDVMLSGALPPWAARATIGIKGKASNGDDLLCMTLSTAPAEAPIVTQQSRPSLALPEAESADVKANSIIDGDDNFNGHDNGVNVNVNVLGIQMKENVESAANVTIDGKNNSNGHDNGVNVDVNVLGIQKKGNVESANVTMDGDGKSAMGEIASILTLLRSMFGRGTNSSGMVVV